MAAHHPLQIGFFDTDALAANVQELIGRETNHRYDLSRSNAQSIANLSTLFEGSKSAIQFDATLRRMDDVISSNFDAIAPITLVDPQVNRISMQSYLIRSPSAPGAACDGTTELVRVEGEQETFQMSRVGMGMRINICMFTQGDGAMARKIMRGMQEGVVSSLRQASVLQAMALIASSPYRVNSALGMGTQRVSYHEAMRHVAQGWKYMNLFAKAQRPIPELKRMLLRAHPRANQFNLLMMSRDTNIYLRARGGREGAYDFSVPPARYLPGSSDRDDPRRPEVRNMEDVGIVEAASLTGDDEDDPHVGLTEARMATGSYFYVGPTLTDCDHEQRCVSGEGEEYKMFDGLSGYWRYVSERRVVSQWACWNAAGELEQYNTDVWAELGNKSIANNAKTLFHKADGQPISALYQCEQLTPAALRVFLNSLVTAMVRIRRKNKSSDGDVKLWQADSYDIDDEAQRVAQRDRLLREIYADRDAPFDAVNGIGDFNALPTNDARDDLLRKMQVKLQRDGFLPATGPAQSAIRTAVGPLLVALLRRSGLYEENIKGVKPAGEVQGARRPIQQASIDTFLGLSLKALTQVAVDDAGDINAADPAAGNDVPAGSLGEAIDGLLTHVSNDSELSEFAPLAVLLLMAKPSRDFFVDIISAGLFLPFGSLVMRPARHYATEQAVFLINGGGSLRRYASTPHTLLDFDGQTGDITFTTKRKMGVTATNSGRNIVVAPHVRVIRQIGRGDGTELLPFGDLENMHDGPTGAVLPPIPVGLDDDGPLTPGRMYLFGKPIVNNAAQTALITERLSRPDYSMAPVVAAMAKANDIANKLSQLDGLSPLDTPAETARVGALAAQILWQETVLRKVGKKWVEIRGTDGPFGPFIDRHWTDRVNGMPHPPAVTTEVDQDPSPPLADFLRGAKVDNRAVGAGAMVVGGEGVDDDEHW